MTLATDLVNDYQFIDGIEPVSVLDVSANVTVSGVMATNGGNVMQEGSGASAIAPEPINQQWTLYAATMRFQPNAGDKITDEHGVTWVIRSVQTIQILRIDFKYVCTTTAQ